MSRVRLFFQSPHACFRSSSFLFALRWHFLTRPICRFICIHASSESGSKITAAFLSKCIQVLIERASSFFIGGHGHNGDSNQSLLVSRAIVNIASRILNKLPGGKILIPQSKDCIGMRSLVSESHIGHFPIHNSQCHLLDVKGLLCLPLASCRCVSSSYLHCSHV